MQNSLSFAAKLVRFSCKKYQIFSQISLNFNRKTVKFFYRNRQPFSQKSSQFLVKVIKYSSKNHKHFLAKIAKCLGKNPTNHRAVVIVATPATLATVARNTGRASRSNICHQVSVVNRRTDRVRRVTHPVNRRRPRGRPARAPVPADVFLGRANNVRNEKNPIS